MHRGGNVDRVDRPGEAIAATLSHQDARLYERPHAFLEEERIPAGSGDEDELERLDRSIWSEQRYEQLVGAGRRQGVQPQLSVIGLVRPPMLVFGPVVHQKEKARS